MAEIKSFVDIEFRTDSSQKSAQIAGDLQNVNKALEGTKKETQETAAKFDEMGRRIASTTGELDRRFKSNRDSLDKTQEEVKQTADAYDAAGKRIASSTGEVDRRFKSNRDAALNANDGVGKLSGGFKGLLGSMAGFAKAGLVAAGISAIGLSVAGVIQTFGTFEQKLADLSAITGASGKDLEFYAESAREMAKTSTMGASEIVNAYQLVGSAKPELLQNAEALKQVTASALTLAEAAGIDVPQAADVMASALNQFGAGADQADRFINVLAAGANFGAAEIADMGEALKMSGVAASNFGWSFEETNAALQLLSTNAIKGSMAGTNLKGVILALETKMSDEFKPSVVGVVQAFENLDKANLGAKEQLKLFGRENLVAGQIFTKNAAQLGELTKNVTGTNMAYEQAEIRADTLKGSQKRLGNAFEELALVLTADSGVGAVLKWLVDGFAGLINIFSFAVGGIVELAKAFHDMGAAVLDFFGVLDPLAEFLGNASDAFSYLGENIEYVRLIMANDLINTVFHVGEFIEVTFRDMAAPVQFLYNVFVDLVAYIMDLSTKAGPVIDAIFGKGAAESIAIQADRVRLLKVEIQDHAAIVAEAGKKYDGYRKAMDETTEAEIYSLKVKKDKTKADDAAKVAMEKEAEAQEELSKEQVKAQKAIDGVKEKLEDELYALEHTTKETAIYNALKSAGVTENSNAGREIAALVSHLEDEKEAAKQAAAAWKLKTEQTEKHLKDLHKANDDVMKEIVKSSEDAVKEEEKIWSGARDTLSGFFFEFAKEGIGAFDTLVEGFQAMLYKMIAEAAANQIILGVSTVLGGSTAANAANSIASGAGGASSAMSMVSGVKSFFSGGMQGGLSALGNNAYSAATNLGLPTFEMAGYGQNAIQALGGQGLNAGTNFLAGAGLNIGAGLIGGYAGSKVFGETTGIGSTVGGIAGTVLGMGNPLFTALGSFLGAGLEKGIGKLFGYGGNNNDGKNVARGNFDFSTDTFGEGAGSGNSWKKGEGKEQAENVTQLIQIVKEFGDLIGGVDLKGSITQDSSGKTTFNGKEFGNATDAINFAFKEIVKNSSEVDDALESVILGFEGTAEEFRAFAQTQIVIDKMIKSAQNLTPEMEAMARGFKGTNEDALLFTTSLISLTDVLSSNAVADATASYASAQQIATDGILGAYNRQSGVLITAIQNFDGSAASMADLNNAMVLSKQAAFDLTVGVMNLKMSMTDMFMSSAKSIREQLMSETELAVARRKERDALMSALDTMFDPTEIEKAGKRINELNNQLFAGLSPEEKEAYGEEFATFAEDASEAVTSRLDALMVKTTESQDTLMRTTGDLLNSYAEKGLESANLIKTAADTILRAAALIPKNISVTSNNATIESVDYENITP